MNKFKPNSNNISGNSMQQSIKFFAGLAFTATMITGCSGGDADNKTELSSTTTTVPAVSTDSAVPSTQTSAVPATPKPTSTLAPTTTLPVSSMDLSNVAFFVQTEPGGGHDNTIARKITYRSSAAPGDHETVLIVDCKGDIEGKTTFNGHAPRLVGSDGRFITETGTTPYSIETDVCTDSKITIEEMQSILPVITEIAKLQLDLGFRA